MSKIQNLKNKIKQENKKQLKRIFKELKEAEIKGLPLYISPYHVESLIEKGSITLWASNINGLSSYLKSVGVDHEIHQVYREVDPYSYWPGDEISGYKTIRVDV